MTETGSVCAREADGLAVFPEEKKYFAVKKKIFLCPNAVIFRYIWKQVLIINILVIVFKLNIVRVTVA